MSQAPGQGNQVPGYAGQPDPSLGYPPAQNPAPYQVPAYPPAGYDPAGRQTPAQIPAGGNILRMGLWNYISYRWAPKNTAGKIAFEIGILVVIFLILAVLLVLSRS
ncbi:MAG TPA: hypothetical protein VF337_12405 [Candidatus Limnocylindrales bacterium]